MVDWEMEMDMPDSWAERMLRIYGNRGLVGSFPYCRENFNRCRDNL
ncbi:MAG: hypothetical protein LBQ54_10855 [Planctomycetaceae bacterium]|jgi:hypothetical protein|nr:hypothetical protein [Planctomycetaceae bacterium]